jgi:uncharacterized FlaG/YvyC family protein
MINNIVNFTQTPDVAHVKPAPAVPAEIAAASGSEKTKNQSSDANLSNGKDKGPPLDYVLRLTVDKDAKTGEWVYKAINRNTGEVVRQIPRQELLDLRKSPGYTAGSVIKTEA